MSDKNFDWVLSALENRLHNYSNPRIQRDGSTRSGDGYIGNIDFLKISDSLDESSTQQLNIVLKSSKDSEILREKLSVRKAFEKEILIYTKVKAAFESLREKNGLSPFKLEIMPECYFSDLAEKHERLILENVKMKGFELWDRKVPMSREHVDLVLKSYSLWHALSFALKAQRPETFRELTANNSNVFSEMVKSVRGICRYFCENMDRVRTELLRRNGRRELFDKLGFTQDQIEYATGDMLDEDPESHVFLHGDCWTNNYLFKHEKDSSPSAVSVLDWQTSGLASPVFDLSFFIYACCDLEKLPKVETLLEVYYAGFKENLRQFGLHSDEVFSYAKLLDHWRRFSRYGLIITQLTLRFSLCEEDEAPDFTKQGHGDFVEHFNNFRLRNEAEFQRSAFADFTHFAENSI